MWQLEEIVDKYMDQYHIDRHAAIDYVIEDLYEMQRSLGEEEE